MYLVTHDSHMHGTNCFDEKLLRYDDTRYLWIRIAKLRILMS
jgi:hypothetical protein